jgi:methylmalonyl-CoA mutase
VDHPAREERYLSEISENNRRYDAQVRKQAEIADQLYGLYSAVLTFGGPDLLNPLTPSLLAGLSEPDGDRPCAMPLTIASTAGNPAPKFESLDQQSSNELSARTWIHTSGPCSPAGRAEEEKYSGEFYTYLVRGKEIKVPNHTESLSHLKIPKVALPKFRSWGDKVRWAMQENTPGFFPTPRASIPSSAPARTPRACSPARAVRSAPTSASTT